MSRNQPAKLAARVRLVAAAAAAMVVFLCLAGYSPELHEAVCHHRHDPVSGPLNTVPAADCAVVHYGEGEVPVLDTAPLIGPGLAARQDLPPAGRTSPREGADWQTPPVCGPPQSRV